MSELKLQWMLLEDVKMTEGMSADYLCVLSDKHIVLNLLLSDLYEVFGGVSQFNTDC